MLSWACFITISDLFCSPPVFFMTPVTNYMLLYSTLLCKKIARAPGVIKNYALTTPVETRWLSCKIWQKNGYLARSARKMVILQDLPEKWLSCKILASSFRSSCPLIGSHSCNTFHFDQKFTSESVACFLRKIINLNRF